MNYDKKKEVNRNEKYRRAVDVDVSASGKGEEGSDYKCIGRHAFCCSSPTNHRW